VFDHRRDTIIKLILQNLKKLIESVNSKTKQSKIALEKISELEV